MDISNFFNKNRIPYVLELDRYFETKVEEILVDYIESVKNDQKYNYLFKEVEHICKAINSAIKTYYNGSPKRAYDKIYDCFKENGKLVHFSIIKKICDIENGMEYKSLFRARCHNGTDIESRKDMFHMPYSKRTILSTQRYSIPGCPSLYLGGSIYDCWLEMGKPSYHEFYVSRFEVSNENLKILDLAHYPDIKKTTQLEQTIILWPLIFTCSIKIKEHGRTFKSEYIIPQLLLQVVKDRNNIDGIRYYSTFMPQYPVGALAPFYINYVFPCTYDNSGDEYSNVFKDNFVLTEPFNIGEYEQYSPVNIDTLKKTASNNTMNKLDQKFIHPNRRNGAVLATPSIISEYQLTLLYNVEELLYYFPALKIN